MKLVTKLMVLIAGCAFSCSSVATDLSGAQDHPLVSRFKGAEIIGYRQVDFDKATFPTGPMVDRAFPKARRVGGRLTAIGYSVPAGKETAEVLENYRRALQAAGFQIVYACHGGRDAVDGACGGFIFGTTYADPIIAHMRGDARRMVNTLDAKDASYLTATLDRAGSKATVGVLVGHDDDESSPAVLLQIVEETPMDQDQVKVDAATIGKGLASAGKIELYGLHFATDSDKLQADSAATLSEMAKALNASPKLKVFIVGHTDNSGTLAHNVELSQKRAEAVVKALHATYAIASERMAAKGLASYSPVAANTNEAAKARNRRVEMVAQ